MIKKEAERAIDNKLQKKDGGVDVQQQKREEEEATGSYFGWNAIIRTIYCLLYVQYRHVKIYKILPSFKKEN